MIADKTKAALQSCQCHYEKPKQIKHTRVNADGQRMSQRNSATAVFIQDFGMQRLYILLFMFFSRFLNSFLSSSSSEFNALYFSGIPCRFIAEMANCNSFASLRSGGKIESGLPIISAEACLQSTVAGQSHVIPICPSVSKTTTSYRSVLLLLSAKNLYSIVFPLSDACVLVASVQPFGSIPPCCSFSRQASLTHELNWPFPAAALICSNKSSSNRMCFIVLPERSKFFFVLDGCIGSYHWCKVNLDGNYHLNVKQLKITKPAGATNTNGPLTKPLVEVTVMAGSQHTQTHPKFTWRFLSTSEHFPAAKPLVIYVNASSEQEARDAMPGASLIFAAHLPFHAFQVMEVRHV